MVISIAVIVGFLVIFQSMYTAVLERTREIGILKSLGSSKGTIVSVVLRETALAGRRGSTAGIAGHIRSAGAVARKVLHLCIRTYGRVDRLGYIDRLCRSDGGALYPAWMAARKDPIDALAYE